MDSVLHKNRGDQVLSLLHKSDIPQDRQRQQRTRVENQHSRLRNLPGELVYNFPEKKNCWVAPSPMPHSDFDNEITTIGAHSSGGVVFFVTRQSLIGAYLPATKCVLRFVIPRRQLFFTCRRRLSTDDLHISRRCNFFFFSLAFARLSPREISPSSSPIFALLFGPGEIKS